MSRWFRHYAGMMRDDKLVRVAIRSGQTIERVCWVYAAMLESAAELDDGGRFDFDIPEAAYFLRAECEELEHIKGELQATARIDGDRISKWNERQFQSDRRGGTSKGSESYVYFVGTTWDAAVKIGFSKNPWARAKELQTGNAAKVEVLAHFRCDANSEVELHNLVAAHRHAGEWFNLPDKISKVVIDLSASAKSYEELLVTLRSALRSTTSIDPETETETETEEELSSNDDSSSDDEPALEIEEVFEGFQALTRDLGLPVPRDLTPERRQILRGRIRQYPLEDFQTVFAKCRDSPFLRGDKGRTPLRFDWLFKKANFQKTLEGNYG